MSMKALFVSCSMIAIFLASLFAGQAMGFTPAIFYPSQRFRSGPTNERGMRPLHFASACPELPLTPQKKGNKIAIVACG